MSTTPELIANGFADQNGMRMWTVSTNIDCLKNYKAVFGEAGLKNLDTAIGKMKQDFYEIKRYFQYVGIFEYHHSMVMYTMKLFEPTSTDSHLDAFIKLAGEDWKKEDLEKVSKISEEIINDDNKIEATLTVYDPIEKFKKDRGV